MDYQMKLYYGTEETEDGTFHSFQLEDSEKEVDLDKMKKTLADSLDIDPDSWRFDYNWMFVKVPEELVLRIKRDAIMELYHRKDNVEKVMDARFERLKEVLFDCGYTDIEDFLGFEVDEFLEKDSVENAMDEVYEQMPDEELEKFYEKYSIS